MIALRCLLLLALALTLNGEFRAGVARVKITPETPVWLMGFGARTHPAAEVGLDLYAKALALEDGAKGRVVIVTADLIGFTERSTNELARRVKTRHGLRRDQIVFLASHTHSGPAVLDRMTISQGEGPAFDREAETYTVRLIDQLEQLISAALEKLEPVSVSSGWAEAGFAFNRRTEQLAVIRPGETFPAPVDHRVPVLRLKGKDGRDFALLFGYACHPTVLTGDTYEVSGDYPGYAQASVEESLPGVTAMFIPLSAGDQRATPRGSRMLAQKHGKSLAEAAMSAKLAPITGLMQTAIEEIRLPFASHTKEAYEAEALSTDRFAARRGKAMLAAMAAKKMPLATAYPIQAIRIGQITLLALPGEVVVDYALSFKARYGNRVIVAGYANFLPGYIPSLRVQREGGYEAGDAMMYFMQPGWFTDEVEPLVLGNAARVLKSIGLLPSGSTSGSRGSLSPNRAR